MTNVMFTREKTQVENEDTVTWWSNSSRYHSCLYDLGKLVVGRGHDLTLYINPEILMKCPDTTKSRRVCFLNYLQHIIIFASEAVIFISCQLFWQAASCHPCCLTLMAGFSLLSGPKNSGKQSPAFKMKVMVTRLTLAIIACNICTWFNASFCIIAFS